MTFTIIIVCCLVLLIVSTLSLYDSTRDRRARERVKKFIEDCHGDLPPIERFKGMDTAFLAALMPHYLAAERRVEVKQLIANQEGPVPRWNKWAVEHALPLDPDEATDCPECDNGVPHETCRSGWREVLRANVRDYAVAKFGSMPAWKTPCDTCFSNCGQCGSSHCARCGAKGVPCDLVQHEAWKLEHPKEHAEAELRKSQEKVRATARAVPRGPQVYRIKEGG